MISVKKIHKKRQRTLKCLIIVAALSYAHIRNLSWTDNLVGKKINIYRSIGIKRNCQLYCVWSLMNSCKLWHYKCAFGLHYFVVNTLLKCIFILLWTTGCLISTTTYLVLLKSAPSLHTYSAQLSNCMILIKYLPVREHSNRYLVVFN